MFGFLVVKCSASSFKNNQFYYAGLMFCFLVLVVSVSVCLFSFYSRPLTLQYTYCAKRVWRALSRCTVMTEDQLANEIDFSQPTDIMNCVASELFGGFS